jgi:hypothetical protein
MTTSRQPLLSRTIEALRKANQGRGKESLDGTTDWRYTAKDHGKQLDRRRFAGRTRG